MASIEWGELPKSVRAEFSRIADAEFDAHPDVAAARDRLGKAEAEHRAAVEAAHRLRTRKAELEAMAGEFRTKARELTEARNERLAEALINGEVIDAEADRQVFAEIARMGSLPAVAEAAIRQIDQRLVDTGRSVHHAARVAESEEEALRGLLDRLKLAEAKHRALA